VCNPDSCSNTLARNVAIHHPRHPRIPPAQPFRLGTACRPRTPEGGHREGPPV